MSRLRRDRVGRRLVLAAGTALLTPVGLVGVITAGLVWLPVGAAASDQARADIPPRLLVLYQQAAARCPGLPWPVLAGIGKVESNHDRPTGQVSAAGAKGPMQFLPITWRQYGTDGNGDGTADPFSAADAIPAAADDLCAHGAATDLQGAVASYLCGVVPQCLLQAQQPDGYAQRVLDWARRYTDPAGAGGPAATLAVQVALAQVGTPYLWGGQSPQTGFDCSGLVQYAFGRAGIALPRTAQTQYDTGPLLPSGTDAQPGDLVFFGGGPGEVDHVGIALGDGRMVDAPHAGALVRVEPIAGFGQYVSASRPAALADVARAAGASEAADAALAAARGAAPAGLRGVAS